MIYVSYLKCHQDGAEDPVRFLTVGSSHEQSRSKALEKWVQSETEALDDDYGIKEQAKDIEAGVDFYWHLFTEELEG